MPEEATIALVCDADEETDGKAGAGYVSSTGALDPDYVFGQGVIDQIWCSGLGLVQHRVDIEGTSSHAGVNPDNSANPDFGAARLLRAIEEYSATHLREESGVSSVDDPTCTPTALTSNGDVSIVPEATTFFIDQRHPTGYDQRELIQDLTRTLETTDLPPRTDVTVTVVDKAEPYHHGQDEEHVAVLHRNANTYFEDEIPVVGTRSSGGRDPDPRWPYRPPKTHYYASLGAKCVHFGPGSIMNNIHGPDEFLHVSEVREVGVVLAASVLDLFG